MTKASPRITRTPTAQSGPIRNPMASPRSAVDAGAAGDMFTAAGAAVCGVLENGVRTAYAVIDEYMRRGQEAARGVFNDPNRRGPMSDERGNFGGGFNSPNPVAAMAEQWMTAMRTWSQMWSAYIPPAWQQAGMNPYPFAGGAAPAAVSVKVSSTRPAEVAVNLYPGVDPLGLICDPLRPDGAGGTPIDGVSIARDGAAVQVSVKIAAKQPEGRYRGNIRRKTDQGIVGEITVTVS